MTAQAADTLYQGLLRDGVQTEMGSTFLPDSQHNWRVEETPVSDMTYWGSLPNEFPLKDLESNPDRGAALLQHWKGLYPTIVAVQEWESQQLQPQFALIPPTNNSPPITADEVNPHFVRTGFRYEGLGIPPRVRRLRYKLPKPPKHCYWLRNCGGILVRAVSLFSLPFLFLPTHQSAQRPQPRLIKRIRIGR